MEQNQSSDTHETTNAQQGTFLPQTEAPQHMLGHNTPQETPSHGGPRFNETVAAEPNRLFSTLEGAKMNGWGMRLASWMRENKQLILGIAGSLILATVTIVAIRTYVPASVPLDAGEQTAVVERAATSEAIGIEPAGTLNDGSITTEAVAQGEGITHVARRAITARMQERGIALSPEERIYAEDFVQNAIGTHGLGVGEKLSFPHTLLDDAIGAAQALSDTQLQNLTQYSATVVF